MALVRRFKHLGKLGDLHRAIEYQIRAVALVPEGHTERPSRLNSLGISYCVRFNNLPKPEHIDKAVEYQTLAISLTPAGHPNKPAFLNNLGTSYRSRFEYSGAVEDIDLAISCQIKAVSLAPEGHPLNATRLGNLGNSYHRRFHRLHDADDLKKAIMYQQQAVLLIPEGHPDRPQLLNNLGGSLILGFLTLHALTDIDKAIDYLSQALSLAPPGSANVPMCLDNLGSAHLQRYKKLNERSDIDKAVDYLGQAAGLARGGSVDMATRHFDLGMAYQERFESPFGSIEDSDEAINNLGLARIILPKGHSRSLPIQFDLGNLWLSRFEKSRDAKDMAKALGHFFNVAAAPTGPPRVRFLAAVFWAKIDATLDNTSSLVGYVQAMEILQEVMWRSQGRSIVWNQILQLRAPFDELAAVNPDLARQLKDIASQLDRSTSFKHTDRTQLSVTAESVEQEQQHHRRLAEKWDTLLSEARDLPGMSNYLRLKRAPELVRAAESSTVVVLNVYHKRCDALIILEGTTSITHVPLPSFSYEMARDACADLVGSLQHAHLRDRGLRRPVFEEVDNEDKFEGVLAMLWDHVVCPVLDHLGFLSTEPRDQLPHITWSVTGPLAFLPIHAAGYYNEPPSRVFDYVVCSYTPTLSAMLVPPRSPTEFNGLLAVGQSNTAGCTPLPGTIAELKAISEQASGLRYTQLDGDNATQEAILAGMEAHDWVHLACHGSQNIIDPTKSAFHVYDGTLDLATITRKSMSGARLAFLSACQTATGDEKIPEEAVHLAAGMIVAGYHTVIATMWSIHDSDAPVIAEKVYGSLLKDGIPDARRAARALHEASLVDDCEISANNGAGFVGGDNGKWTGKYINIVTGPAFPSVANVLIHGHGVTLGQIAANIATKPPPGHHLRGLMFSRYRSEDDASGETPRKRSKLDDSNIRLVEQDNTTVPLDVLKAEARERRDSDSGAAVEDDLEADENDDNCIICLQPVVDRTVLINCAHDRMCFACIKQWSEQSRRCPLCNSPIGTHLIHRIRSQHDYQKYYLPPLRTSPPPNNIVVEARAARRARARRGLPTPTSSFVRLKANLRGLVGTATAEETERDELDRAIEMRRWVYRHGLFAKHVASNAYTRFRPNPTPQQISGSPELQSRCQMFVRRELRVWPNMDVEFLTSFILSLVKSIDIRTEAAIKLIAEFLDLGGRRSPTGGTIAEHFVHELYSYLRSPFRDLPAYDAVVQYDTPADIESAPVPPGPPSHTYRTEPGPSQSSEHKGKAQERDLSDPLDASPRDIDLDSDSEEDWVEPPPINSKGKARDTRGTQERNRGGGDYGCRDVGSGGGDRKGGQPSTESRDARNDQHEGERHSRRYEETRHRDRYDNARHSEPENREQYSETRQHSAYDAGRGSRGRGDNHVDPNGMATRQRSRESQQDNDRMERRSQKPAGWDNFFEDDRLNGQAIRRQSRSPRYPSSRSRSRVRSPTSRRSRSRSSYEHGRRRRGPSPVGHHRLSSSDSRVPSSGRPLTTSVANHLEDNWAEPTPSEQTTGKYNGEASSSGHDSGGGDNTASALQPGMITKSVARSRPSRLTPMDAIRVHLQGPSRTSRSVPANAGGNLSPNPETQLVGQDGADSKNASADSREATEAPTVLGTLLPNMSGKPPMPLVEMVDGRTLDGNNASPHVTTSTSHRSPTASYSIRGAAARPKPQPAPPSSFDSIQRASPGSPYGPNPSYPARSRLLARLEAAKSVDTISNTDTDASHLSGKPAQRPTPAEIPEAPVSRTQIATAQEEQRPRLMARSRLLRSATSGEGPSPDAPQGDNVGTGSRQEEKTGDPRVPAEVNSPTAMETERRLRLQARLAARKRDITALMGAPSSADAPPRHPSSGTPTVIDRVS
ncbi:hypothetical protein FRC10_003291 [Ceratobasidium sp. 414]|nr:hypothetical protein FRC10_003291 [Ceratobasidium sp. 414]